MKEKVAFFVESMHCGGAERSLLSLLNNISHEKYDIDLLVIKKGGEFEKFIPSWINYKSVDPAFGIIGRVKFKIQSRLKPNVHKAQLFWRSFRNQIEIYSEEYDIAVGWGQGFATYFIAEKIKSKKKFAWVNTDYEKAGYKFDYDKNIYEKFDKIVGVSEFVKDSMQKFINKDRVTHIRNIIDADDIIVRANQLRSIDFNTDQLSIVSIGRLAKQKAFELSIETAKILDEKEIDFKWYIIGEGTERSNLELLIQSYNLNDKVILLGFRDNPYPYIKACDIYIQTSKFEGLGRTLIEAAILQKPIVSTDFPTAYELVDEGRTGFIAKMDANDIAKKIVQLYLNNELYNKMVEELSSKLDDRKQETLRTVYQLFDREQS